MNKLGTEKRAQVIGCLVEGNSIRATVRMTGAAKNTVVKLLTAVGKACADYQDKVFHDLPCTKIQCDEIWSFCYSKEKNVPADHKGEWGYGDVYTWTAIDADTKLIPSYFVGRRDAQCAHAFMTDLVSRLKHRVQLTTDGHKPYLQAVDDAFGGEIDYAMLVKTYGNAQSTTDQRRYSPAECTGIEKFRYVENLTKKKSQQVTLNVKT